MSDLRERVRSHNERLQAFRRACKQTVRNGGTSVVGKCRVLSRRLARSFQLPRVTWLCPFNIRFLATFDPTNNNPPRSRYRYVNCAFNSYNMCTFVWNRCRMQASRDILSLKISSRRVAGSMNSWLYETLWAREDTNKALPPLTELLSRTFDLLNTPWFG